MSSDREKQHIEGQCGKKEEAYYVIFEDQLRYYAELSVRGNITIVSPHQTYIQRGVQIGKDSMIHPFVRIYEGASIGAYCIAHAGAHMVGEVCVGDQCNIGANVCLEGHVRLGNGCMIGANTSLKGNITLGRGCIIHANVVIFGDVEIGEHTEIRPFSYIAHKTYIGKNSVIGPHPDIRESQIGEGAKIEHAQIKRTKTGKNFRAKHESYVGDAKIGDNVNIGAGTITCNFDGKNKNKTIINDGVFVGSNSNLVAPIELGEGAYTAAGSTITKDVPPRALAIARAQQVNKENWKKG